MRRSAGGVVAIGPCGGVGMLWSATLTYPQTESHSLLSCYTLLIKVYIVSSKCNEKDMPWPLATRNCEACEVYVEL